MKTLAVLVLLLSNASLAQNYDLHIKQLAAWNGYTDALLDDGTLSDVGGGYQEYFPHENIVQIYSGDFDKCALMSDGQLKCIKQNLVPTDLGSILQVSVGRTHACALTDKGIRCWGNNTYGEVSVPYYLGVVTQISAGDGITCVISDGQVVCWGRQYISGTDFNNVAQISAGGDVCARSTDGLIRCWGTFAKFMPPNLKNVSLVATGREFDCAVAEGQIQCWGNVYNGLNNPPTGLKNIRQIVTTKQSACALSDDGVSCWGNPSYGFRVSPRFMRLKKIQTSNNHTCVISTLDMVSCWNHYGEIWQHKFQNVENFSVGGGQMCVVESGKLSCFRVKTDVATMIPSPLENIGALSLAGHSCAAANNHIECWFVNGWGQFITYPMEINNVVQLSTVGGLVGGGEYGSACAVLSDATMKCWTLEEFYFFKYPENLTNVKQVSMGGLHACALVNTEVLCWHSWYSTFPESNLGQIDVPANLGAVVQISSGDLHSCALDDQGVVTCWGSNEFGQVSVPQDLGVAFQVSAGFGYTCTLTDGGPRCWGDSSRAVKIP